MLEWTAVHRYRNILVSNNYLELPEMMVRLGLASYFQEMLVSVRLGYEKPIRLSFSGCWRQPGILHSPEACVIIGDNPCADIEGGKRAGLKTVLVHRKDNGISLADASIAVLGDLPDCLRDIGGRMTAAGN